MIRLSLLWTLCLFLAPLLWVQGIYVGRRAIRLPEAAGPKEMTGGSFRMLVLGDSIVAGVGVTNTEDSLASQLASRLTEQRGELVNWLVGEQKVKTETGFGTFSIGSILLMYPRTWSLLMWV